MEITQIIGILLILYIFSFGILFIFPTLIHKKKSFFLSKRILSNKGIACFSHRGGGKECFENSLSAFRNSMHLKYFGVELDIHKTKDGKFVVAHDPNLFRITDQDVFIKNIEYANIANYKIKIFDTWAEDHDIFEKAELEKPPLLEDVMDMLKKTNMVMCIDLKTNDPEDLILLVNLIVQKKFQDRVIIGSFDSSKSLKTIKEPGVNVPIFFDKKSVEKFGAFLVCGLLPFVDFKHDFLVIPHYFESIIKAKAHSRLFGGKKGMLILWMTSFYFNLICWHMNRRGIPVIFWILNTVKDWKAGIKMNANGFITDKPTEMKNFLKSQNKYFESD